MALKKSLPKASEEKIQAIEKSYWAQKFYDILKDWRLYVMILPLLFFLICWKYFPIASMVVSFKYYRADSSFGGGVYTSNFIGFDSFLYLFQQKDFWQAFRNTFTLSFYSLVFGFPFPIILALFFSEIKNTAYRSIVQVFAYIPKFISVVVMTSLIGMLLRSSSQYAAAGVIGGLLERGFGLTNLLSSPSAFRSIFVVSGLWSEAGYGSIVYFAAIIGISPTNYEAARIDGATKMQQIKYVTIPSIASTLIIMLILRLGNLLSIGYEKVYLLQQLGTPGSTYETSQIISTYVINVIMTSSSINQGIGAAADMFNSLLSMFLVLGSNAVAKKVSSTSLF